MIQPNLSEGAHQLSEAATAEGIADRLTVSARTARRWRSSATTPGAPDRERIREAFGVDPGAWDRAAKAENAERTGTAEHEPSEPDDGMGDGQPSRVRLNAQLATLRRDLVGASTSQRINIHKQITAILTALAKFDAPEDTGLDALIARIIDAITPYPAALVAVVNALTPTPATRHEMRKEALRSLAVLAGYPEEHAAIDAAHEALAAAMRAWRTAHDAEVAAGEWGPARQRGRRMSDVLMWAPGCGRAAPVGLPRELALPSLDVQEIDTRTGANAES